MQNAEKEDAVWQQQTEAGLNRKSLASFVSLPAVVVIATGQRQMLPASGYKDLVSGRQQFPNYRLLRLSLIHI